MKCLNIFNDFWKYTFKIYSHKIYKKTLKIITKPLFFSYRFHTTHIENSKINKFVRFTSVLNLTSNQICARKHLHSEYIIISTRIMQMTSFRIHIHIYLFNAAYLYLLKLSAIFQSNNNYEIRQTPAIKTHPEK